MANSIPNVRKPPRHLRSFQPSPRLSASPAVAFRRLDRATLRVHQPPSTKEEGDPSFHARGRPASLARFAPARVNSLRTHGKRSSRSHSIRDGWLGVRPRVLGRSMLLVPDMRNGDWHRSHAAPLRTSSLPFLAQALYYSRSIGTSSTCSLLPVAIRVTRPKWTLPSAISSSGRSRVHRSRAGTPG